jgi:TRAP transporter TAXI family solute receptor
MTIGSEQQTIHKKEEKMDRTRASAVMIMFIVSCLIIAGGKVAEAAPAKTISMGCGPAVAAGYPVGVALSNFLNKRIEGFKLVPVELGTVAALRRVAADEMDMTYSSAFDIVSAYTNTGAFEKQPFKEGTQPYQGIWFWPTVQFMVTRTDTNIHSLDDLKGKKVSLGSPKEGIYNVAKAAFQAMGLTNQWSEKIVEGSDRAQALKDKHVDAVLGVVVGMNTLAGHTMQVELYNELRAVGMSKAQEEIIERTPGISFIKVPAKLFKRNMGMDEIPGFGIMYGWSFARSVDLELVYQFVKNCFENSAKLVELARLFEMFNRDPKGTASLGLKACSIVPIHPGAAKYYREIGIWNPSWIEGKR